MLIKSIESANRIRYRPHQAVRGNVHEHDELVKAQRT